jgi:CRP-like cAMP-binding protein
MNGLIKYLSNKIDVSFAVKEYILSISLQKKTQKGDILISQGNKIKFIYFVEDGCLRSYSLDKDGKEHTLQFAIKNWWISDFTAINNNILSELSVECVQEANIIQISLDDFYQALKRFPELDKIHKKNLENRISSLERRILDQLMLTALQRYEEFKKKYSDIEPLIPNYCIASYLGMAKESLSRIRIKNSELT